MVKESKNVYCFAVCHSQLELHLKGCIIRCMTHRVVHNVGHADSNNNNNCFQSLLVYPPHSY